MINVAEVFSNWRKLMMELMNKMKKHRSRLIKVIKVEIYYFLNKQIADLIIKRDKVNFF
jgi:hypothetical protein